MSHQVERVQPILIMLFNFFSQKYSFGLPSFRFHLSSISSRVTKEFVSRFYSIYKDADKVESEHFWCISFHYYLYINVILNS